MVAQGVNRKIRGSGMMDPLMKPFTVDKYNIGERHARSLDPNHFLQGYNYVGPFTDLKYREQIHDDKPLNDLDAAARNHDYSYLKEDEEYARDHDKQKHINNVWKADDIFVERSKNSRDDPIVGNISSKLIATKESLWKSGVLDSKIFSGFGSKEEGLVDPVARLRNIVAQQYKTDERKERKIEKNAQHGGSADLPVIGKVANELVKSLYNVINKKNI